MASACVNNVGRISDGSSYSSYGWLSPRISFSRDFSEDEQDAAEETLSSRKPEIERLYLKSDQRNCSSDLIDFEFCLDDSVTMLPADELFSDGKLVPLQLPLSRPASDLATVSVLDRSPEVVKKSNQPARRISDALDISPRAPRCSSRWKELLGLKKLSSPKPDLQKTTSEPSKNSNPKSLKNFLNRSSKTCCSDLTIDLPLLRDSDSELVAITSRLSLSSSSSSSREYEDPPRLSLDSDKRKNTKVILNRNRNAARSKASKPRNSVEKQKSTVNNAARAGRSPVRRAPNARSVPARGVSVDSPRMNSSGKIVFQSLERSSSSPSSFNGGPRTARHRSMERSYSGNIRITPVLNVPVCTLRGSSKSNSVFGLGHLFSQQKRDTDARARIRSRSDRN